MDESDSNRTAVANPPAGWEWTEDPAFATLVDAARYLCWLCTEHAGLSEPEDLEAVGDVQRALRALGVDVDPVDEEVSRG